MFVVEDAMANELFEYFDSNVVNTEKFAEMFCAPHLHHHEKKASARKSISGPSHIHHDSSVGKGDYNQKVISSHCNLIVRNLNNLLF